jgi:class 3 adenylate cyclase/tetratricopeptide (TPR) repeat protein
MIDAEYWICTRKFLGEMALSDIALTLGGPSAPTGERRQVTVLFADLVGFTAMSERLGEEGTHVLIQPIYELMATAVREQGGSVKDFIGDGMMALFGVPKALEDGPLRACRAALLIHKRMAAMAPLIEAQHGVRPQLRIGINTGLVVVTHIRGESASMAVLGDTVNLASRLQTVADPGTIVLGEATHRLVQGLVEASFTGTHSIKGKSEPQRTWRVDSIRAGATRFEAAVGRGLSSYVGRERELALLERSLTEAVAQVRAIDIVAEPGMGKSRLLHEFSKLLDREQAVILSGYCSPDGRQTPFLPFIEVVRRAFQVSAGEAEREVGDKLNTGLTILGLNSTENLALLLNLLGLKPPDGSLVGLDGVLIGLRTRELLQRLLEARCRLSPIVLLIEDIHWIDSVSEELLRNIVNSAPKLPLLILHTRRPEYQPDWRDARAVTRLPLEPLPPADVQRLVQARLGVEVLPDALVRLLTEKTQGNALFAEEIVTFLTERGALRTTAGGVEFAPDTVAGALPASIQSLLTARVDQLSPEDRGVLQAAAVIGRRFELDLLADVAVPGDDVGARLMAMKALDLVHFTRKSGAYTFKHALVCDVLYQSMLTEARTALHFKIAQEIERRSGNRLAEVAEILAYHYSRTKRSDKAFIYLTMAGTKSLGVYSLDEASANFAAAVELLEIDPDCATDQQVAKLLVAYTLCSNLSLHLKSLIAIVERFRPRIERATDSHDRILIQHHYVLGLLWSARYREAEKIQSDLSAMAARLGDARSKAYAIASALHLSTFVTPYPIATFIELHREAIAAAEDDVYLQHFILAAAGWDELSRGRVAMAHQAAEELLAVGRQLKDPRSMGYAMALKAWIALTSDDYERALEFAERSMNIARAPFERETAHAARNVALVLLRRPEAMTALRNFIDQCAINGWHAHSSGSDAMWGIALAMNGEIGKGIRWVKKAISRREREGYRAAADWCRMFLCEIYLEIISGKEKAPLKVLVRNIFTVITIRFTATPVIYALVGQVRQNPQFDPRGHFFGRCEMILGELHKIKNKRALAIRHLAEAQRIVSQLGRTPMLTRIEASLADLGERARSS